MRQRGKYLNSKCLILAVMQDINGIGIIIFQYDVPQLGEATIYCTAGKATYDNMTHAHCMLIAKDYKHTLSICNTYCFSTVTM